MLGAVELAVVEIGQDDVFHVLARCYRWNQAAHQQARQRSIAVREMVDVGLLHFGLGFFANRLQVHRGKTREAYAVGVSSSHGIDAQGHKIVGAPLKILHRRC
ncbi:hypothetical protein D3C72_2021950 [compost metagenome]